MAARQSLKPWWRSRGVKTAPKRGGLVWFNLVDGGWCRLEDFLVSGACLQLARVLLDSPLFLSQLCCFSEFLSGNKEKQ